jgi:hypothetical protein
MLGQPASGSELVQDIPWYELLKVVPSTVETPMHIPNTNREGFAAFEALALPQGVDVRQVRGCA